MRLSEDRISHLSHLIHDRLYLDEFVNYIDEALSLKIVKEAISDFFSVEDQLDDVVRQKIKTLKKNVSEGTPEWNVLHRKYLEEELRKKGL